MPAVLAVLLLIAAPAGVIAQGATPAADVRIALPPSQERWRETVLIAVSEAASLGENWLGPRPTESAWDIAIDPPAWQGRASMIVEAQAARSAIRSWWPADVADDAARDILDGIASYLQARTVERVFNQQFQLHAYRAASLRLFGGEIAWSLPMLRVSRQTATRAAVRAADDVRVARYAATFATLERWLGEAELQSALLAVARLPSNRLSGPIIVETVGAAAGQDLTWLFAAVSDPQVTFDYAVIAIASVPSESSFESRVTVARLEAGAFTGRSDTRVGSFDAGDAMALRVTFANGEQAWARWDGRDESRTFTFQGPSPATAAHLDPNFVLMLDSNRLNNAIVPAAPTNAPVRKWMARWMVWLQNAVLSYGFFA